MGANACQRRQQLTAGTIYTVRMKPSVEANTRRITYHFTVTDESKGQSSTLTLDAMSHGSQLELLDGTEVSWLLKSPRELLIYSDNFLIKTLSQCRSAAIEAQKTAAVFQRGQVSRFPWEMKE